MKKLIDLIDKYADELKMLREPEIIFKNLNMNIYTKAYKNLEFKIQKYQYEWVKE